MFKLGTSLLAVTIVLLFKAVISENDRDTNGTNEFSESERSRVLSRQKRFLIFPDGSSLQLVFCLQTAALIPIGDIFLYANTAALAWTLPTDPMFITDLKDKIKAERRGDTKMIGYLDEKGRVIAKIPYQRRLIVNPAFAKRSIDDQMSFKEKLKIRLDKTKMHQDHTERDYLMRHGLDSRSIDFHRNSRLELFGKLETLIKALGQNGRQCILYKLCESAQRREQGTFLQEFLRVVFTLPKGKEFEEEYHKEYDRAHITSDECMEKYPGCNFVTQ